MSHFLCEQLDGLRKIRVQEACHCERILPGRAYIAPSDQLLAIARSGATFTSVLSNNAPVNRHRPSVEVLFRSVARATGANAAGVMLTGMGKDGATAMLEMRQAGSFNIAQDEATCVVFGMPREALRADVRKGLSSGRGKPATNVLDRLEKKYAALALDQRKK